MNKKYFDKKGHEIKDEDFVLVESDIVCQALRCEDGTLLYEEQKYNFNKGKLELRDEPYYPDSYKDNELEVISYNKAVSLLRKNITMKTEAEIKEELASNKKALEKYHQDYNKNKIPEDVFQYKMAELGGVMIALSWVLGENDRYD